jgi:hypothetical protein
MSMFNLAFSDDYARMRVDELLREAENDRLVDQAIGPGRSIRIQIAGWLIAVAQRIEDRPQAPVARAEA